MDARLPASVTDHAVLRFLERVCGVDVEALRLAIAEGCEKGCAAGAPVIRYGNARFINKHGIIVTTLSIKQPVGWDRMRELMRDD